MTTQTNQYLGRLLAAWAHMAQDGQPPAYGELRPEALRFILPDVCLIDVANESEFSFRLVGTGIVERLRADPTGEALDALGAKTAAPMAELFAATVAGATPMAATGRLEIGGNDRVLDLLCLPLADKDGDITILLVGIEFRSWAEVEVDPVPGELQIWEVETAAQGANDTENGDPQRYGNVAC